MLPLYCLLQLGCSTAVKSQQGQPVTVSNKNGRLEISNGLLGIVIPAAGTVKGEKLPAPIQSFIYRDGQYSDNTPNFVESDSRLAELRVSIKSKTADRVEVECRYLAAEKLFRFSRKAKEAPAAPQGKGYYITRIVLERGSKSARFEVEGNFDLRYEVKISNGLNPNQARYRGWAAYTPEQGVEPDGKIYRPEEDRGYPLDATVNLNYSKTTIYPRVVLWEPAGGENNSGRYWQIYNQAAGQGANLFGMFQGPPSRLIGAYTLGPNLRCYSEDPLNKEKQTAEILVEFNMQWPAENWYARKRYQWAAYISTKKDLLAHNQTQPIAVEMNRVSGLAAVIRKYAAEQLQLPASFYEGAIYMPGSAVQELRRRIKTDEAFFRYVSNTETTYRQVWNAWRYPDSARALLKRMLNVKNELIAQYTIGEGIYHNNTRYWKGARAFKLNAISIAALFMEPTLNMSAAERKNLATTIGLMGQIVWDDNNVPAFDSSGVNMGPANMAFQYDNNARVFFALLLANNPAFKKRAAAIAARVQKDLDNSIYPNGASIGTPHYTQASVEPIFYTMLQLRQSGQPMQPKWYERLAAFGRFYASLCTPTSVRFSGNRKLISFGDGSEESAASFGLLATLLQQYDPLLSKQLRNIFFNGPVRTSFAGPVMLAVDISNPPEKQLFPFATANFTGYLSHFRAAPNTAYESALWVLNGIKLFDHRNDDAGELALYALGAPLSLSRSSFYYPAATDARIRSVVVPEQLFPEWSAANQPITGRSLTNKTWPQSDLQEFAHFGYAASTRILMKTPAGNSWLRQVTAISINSAKPVYLFYDSVIGNAANIWSMLMMSEGKVNTPAGLLEPAVKLHNNGSSKELPAGTPAKKTAAGWNKYGFTGQQWKLHPAGGINWDLYCYSGEEQQFSLAQWTSTWQNHYEIDEFRATEGRQYSEAQQILRLKSSKPFLNVLLPYLKSATAPVVNVSRQPANELAIDQGSCKLLVSATGCIAEEAASTYYILLTDKGKLVHNAVQLTGGQMAVQVSAKQINIRVHGNSGRRTILIPVKRINAAAKYPGLSFRSVRGGVEITLDYKNAKTDLAPGEKGYSAYNFTIAE